jgi:TolA-binding protein
LVNCNNLPPPAYQIDLSTDENIIKWASKLLRSVNPDLSVQLSKLRDLAEKLPSDSELPIDIFELRKKRLQKLPESFSQMEGFDQILADYLRSTGGQKLIERYVDTNRDGLLEKYFDEELSKTLEKARESGKKEIAEKEQRIRSLTSEIEELENKQEELKSSELGRELEEMKLEIDSLREEKQLIHDVDKLKAHKEFITDEIEQLKNKERAALSLLQKAQDRFGKDQEENKLKLIELKIGLDAISGNVKTTTDLKESILQATSFKNISGKGDDARLDVVKTLTNNLEKRGRIVTQDDIAVLLTCTIQSLIVTLAGKPGSGKSSTVNELAHVLGIKEGKKYAHVQVQRGWSSDRDLLGFYNKLNRCYEPDRFGLYKLLNGLQEVSSEHQFSVVLLDEANLSPIEHYWAAFMDACDNPDSFSPSGQSLKLPKGLHFITTVN